MFRVLLIREVWVCEYLSNFTELSDLAAPGWFVAQNLIKNIGTISISYSQTWEQNISSIYCSKMWTPYKYFSLWPLQGSSGLQEPPTSNER